jgi:hypothetical protein
VESISRKSQKLIHCKVFNQEGTSSIRLIEIEVFKMWEHLLRTRHEMQICEPQLCLWINETAYDDNAEIFDHAGEVKNVDLIEVHIFDVEYGFTHTIERYSLATETEQVVLTISSHIPETLEGQYNLEVVPGYIIIQKPSDKEKRPMILGLTYE